MSDPDKPVLGKPPARTFVVHVVNGAAFAFVGWLAWTRDSKTGTQLTMRVVDGDVTRHADLDPRNYIEEVLQDEDGKAVGIYEAYNPRKHGVFIGEWAKWLDDNPDWPARAKLKDLT